MKMMMLFLAALLVSVAASGQEFAISTNLVDYANLGTLNVEASYGVAQHWSVDAGAKYNPFSFGNGGQVKQNRQRSLSAGARYWPWHIYSGWWLAASLRWQEYNAGGLDNPETAEGDRFGSAVKGGYSYMVSRHFNLNIGMGVWAGRDAFTVYSCPTCGRVVDHGAKFFVLPSDFIMSLSYIF